MSLTKTKKCLSQILLETIPAYLETLLSTVYVAASRRRTSYGQGGSEDPTVNVYDVINAGPRHRFATSNLIVSNCLGLGYGMSTAKFVLSCHSMGLFLDPMPEDKWPELDRRLRFVLANNYGTCDLDYLDHKELGEFFTADKVVQDWRRANPKVTQYWANLERSLRASAEAGRSVHYFRLPSSRLKPYFRPSIKPELKTYVDPETGEKKTSVRNALTAAVIKDKPAVFFHGGSLAENITQATARDIMAQCAVDVERLLPQCKYMWSCYDEIIFEVPEDECEEMNKRIPEIMCHGPSVSEWIDDNLPLEVEGGIFDRYCK